MRIKAFTMVEMIFVIVLIGILSMAMMINFSDSDDRALRYKVEGCVNTINGKIQNFLMIALTSKAYISWDETYFPDYYFIDFSETGFTFKGQESNKGKFIMQEVWKKDCKSDFEEPLVFERSWFDSLKMTRGFRQIDPTESVFFTLLTGNENTSFFTGEIDIKLNRGENGFKDTAKLLIDTRSESIYLKKCLFYREGNVNECSEREK